MTGTVVIGNNKFITPAGPVVSLTFERRELLPALGLACQVAGQRTAFEPWQYVNISPQGYGGRPKLRAAGSGQLELWLSADGLSEGFCLRAAELKRTVDALPEGRISIRLDTKQADTVLVQSSGGGAKFRLRCQPDDYFPVSAVGAMKGCAVVPRVTLIDFFDRLAAFHSRIGGAKQSAARVLVLAVTENGLSGYFFQDCNFLLLDMPVEECLELGQDAQMAVTPGDLSVALATLRSWKAVEVELVSNAGHWGIHAPGEGEVNFPISVNPVDAHMRLLPYMNVDAPIGRLDTTVLRETAAAMAALIDEGALVANVSHTETGLRWSVRRPTDNASVAGTAEWVEIFDHAETPPVAGVQTVYFAGAVACLPRDSQVVWHQHDKRGWRWVVEEGGPLRQVFYMALCAPSAEMED